jgi:hypothetical protein
MTMTTAEVAAALSPTTASIVAVGPISARA